MQSKYMAALRARVREALLLSQAGPERAGWRAARGKIAIFGNNECH